jgi:hypothetical protein
LQENVMVWTRGPNDALYAVPAFVEENRKAKERAEQERAASRLRDLVAQASPHNEPQMRITTWERLHALSLPRAPDHPLTRLIAAQTGLTLSQVHDEQGRRAEVVSQ